MKITIGEPDKKGSVEDMESVARRAIQEHEARYHDKEMPSITPVGRRLRPGGAPYHETVDDFINARNKEESESKRGR